MLSQINTEDLEQRLLDSASWVIFSKDLVLVDSETSCLPKYFDVSLEHLGSYLNDVHQLSDLEGNRVPFLTIDLEAEQPELEGCEFVPLRDVMMNMREGAFDLVGRAWQLSHFYRTHRYCGQCGYSMARVTWETAMQCKKCDHRCYPRVSPCIIVAIYRGNEILLALNARHTKTNMYSTLAGFVESGETLEQAVKRETFEEVGVSVCDIEYIDSQPWPFPHALMVGYIAKWQSGEIKPDNNEILDAQWFSVDDLPNTPPTFSIAGRLIQRVLESAQYLESE